MDCVWGVKDAESVYSQKEVNHGGVACDYHGECAAWNTSRFLGSIFRPSVVTRFAHTVIFCLLFRRCTLHFQTCIQLIQTFTYGFHCSPPHFFQLFPIIFTVKNPGQNICPPLDLLIEAADLFQNLSTVAVQKSRHHSGTSQIHRQPIMLRGGISFLYLHHFPVFPIPGKGNRYFPLCVVQQGV